MMLPSTPPTPVVDPNGDTTSWALPLAGAIVGWLIDKKRGALIGGIGMLMFALSPWEKAQDDPNEHALSIGAVELW